ncbi:MAG: stage V sporulation protein AC [Christensenellales bacterium]|jgi:stage V sporulation protein AC
MVSNEEKREYEQYVMEKMPKSPIVAGSFKAFLVGGLICMIGQAAGDFARYVLALTDDMVSAFAAIFMIFLGAMLTGIGIYDRIGKFAGAGSIVPITGFANSVVAPAMEFRREGLVLGVGAKIFTIAGPVLVYGIGSSVIVGLIYWLTKVL